LIAGSTELSYELNPEGQVQNVGNFIASFVQRLAFLILLLAPSQQDSW
jgi:hypothetical protein